MTPRLLLFFTLRTMILLISISVGVPLGSQTYSQLVFEGAGIRGIAYAGVLRELEARQQLPNIRAVVGTSAGAITALMVALGYSADEVYSIIGDTRFQRFNQGGFPLVGGIVRMRNRYGWYRSKRFDHWLADIIAAKAGTPDLTFAELHGCGYKELYVTGTCLNRQSLLVFSADAYPAMRIRDAVRISMSVPFYFEAIFIDSLGRVHDKPSGRTDLDVVVDGGIIGNFPIGLFDSIAVDAAGQQVRQTNPKTLGVRIDSDEQIAYDTTSCQLAPLPINNLTDGVSAFYLLVLESLNRSTLTPDDWARTLSVSSVGIGPKVKRLSDAQKAALIRSGEQAAQRFFKNET